MAEVEAHPGAAAWAVTVDPAAPADLCVVDALARLQLAVARGGGRIRVHGATNDLRRLLELAGLADVVDCPAE
jgi:hypothetical protein